MSKLEELIAELCPDGVEYVRINDCVEKIKNIKWSDSKSLEYKYIDLRNL